MPQVQTPGNEKSTQKKFGEFFLLACKKIGIWQAIGNKIKTLSYEMLSKLGIDVNGKVFSLNAKQLKYPVYCRYGTSDYLVFMQMFINQEYAGLGNIEDNVKTIVDCGANVGYSAAYFLAKYPQAKVIVVEPDPDNFEMCRKNLAPWGDRVSFVNSAIWSSKVGLVLERPEEGSKNEWGIQVRPRQKGEKADLEAIDIKSLLSEFDLDRVDILKIDIETAEAEVFSRNYREWLNLVNYIAIEIHNQQCEDIFFQALSSYKYHSWTGGELTFCKLSPQIELTTATR